MQNLAAIMWNVSSVDVKGKITLDKDGKMQFTWPEDNRVSSDNDGENPTHMREIARHTEERYNPHVDEIQDELKKYRQMEDFVVKAPSRTKKTQA